MVTLVPGLRAKQKALKISAIWIKDESHFVTKTEVLFCVHQVQR